MCVGCGFIQPPRPELGHFGILGLSRAWTLSSKDIDKAWRRVSRQVHPDRFAGKSAVERRMSLQWTASLNEARRVLKDQDRRARYLATGQAEPPESGGPQLDPDFMEEVFELQMEARMDPEATRERVLASTAQYRDEIDAHLASWEAGTDLNGPLIEERLARLKYLQTALNLVGG